MLLCFPPSRPDERASAGTLRAGHAPDHIAYIVCQQHRPVGTDRHTHRAPVGLTFVRREKAGQDIAWRPRWAPVLEWNEHQFVATQLAAVPGAMLSDRHAVRKTGKCASGQPAEAERRGVPA